MLTASLNPRRVCLIDDPNVHSVCKFVVILGMAEHDIWVTTQVEVEDVLVASYREYNTEGLGDSHVGVGNGCHSPSVPSTLLFERMGTPATSLQNGSRKPFSSEAHDLRKYYDSLRRQINDMVVVL